MSSARVLIIEDDTKVAGAVRSGLAAEGYDAVVSRTGEDGYFRATTEPFDAILLDVGLPGRDGLAILGGLRSQGFTTPVLILTARDAVEDRVTGLDAGADDYLVKPFAFAELLARRGRRVGPETYRRRAARVQSSTSRSLKPAKSRALAVTSTSSFT